jgi:low temperature requirement protein LtrA
MLWGVGAAAAIVVPLAGAAWRNAGLSETFRVSESMAERFALFTIIVLGEVVVGVVDGLTEAGGSWTTTGVGLLCLGIGFGIWWNYFDFVGRRPPRPGLGIRGLWLVMHLPLSMSVAATGAGMVSLIEHATDDRTPTATAWLIGGSTALLCVSLSVIVSLMPERPGARLVPYSLVAAALAALAAAAVHPRPWLLATVLVVLLSLVWVESFVRHARLGEPFVEDADLT